jgi:hypothetical protein
MPTAKQLARLLAPREARASVALDGQTQTWAEPLSNERLAEIRERERAATPGPWEVDEACGDVWSPSIWRSIAIVEDLDLPLVNSEADRAFIAAARQDIPDLLAEVERLRARIQDLEGATDAE